MAEFLTLQPPIEALQKFLKAISQITQVTELVDTAQALGRVITEPIYAPYSLPAFPRSTVDGYAVRAADTFGASDNLPVYLHQTGEIQMGKSANIELKTTHCVLIHTGGMLPEGSDAVVMVEYTQHTQSEEIEIFRSVAVGENTIKIGEDVSSGEEVILKGSRIRPAEIGGLMALGLTQVKVVRKPRVGILSSGDEVIAPGAQLSPGQVYDINTYTLSALIRQYGGEAVGYGITPDNEEALSTAAGRALSECDMVVITAGSSASTRDLTAKVIHSLGQPGVLVHGINLRPGKPTILAVCQNKAVIGLPGNPVSALVVANLFVVPVLEKLLGIRQPTGLNRRNLSPFIRARLATNVSSQAGREDWIPVRLTEDPSGMQAEPVFSKSNLIFSLVRADGLFCIPPDVTGLSAGESVDVILFI